MREIPLPIAFERLVADLAWRFELPAALEALDLGHVEARGLDHDTARMALLLGATHATSALVTAALSACGHALPVREEER